METVEINKQTDFAANVLTGSDDECIMTESDGE